MENFNLDHLQKKTPYPVPESFFSEIQENVLKEVIKPQKKQTKFFALNSSFITSFAAALALILGFAFLWKTNQTEITKSTDKEDTIAVRNDLKKAISTTKTQGELMDFQKPNTFKSPENHSSAKELIASSDNDSNYDQLLNSLTDEEITELTKDNDQDIYLELYN